MTIKQILYCTDFSDNAEAAFTAAVEMAEKFQAKLSVVHVTPPIVNPVFTEPDTALYMEKDDVIILKLEERMQQEYGVRISDSVEYEMVVLNGHVSSEILAYIDDCPIDLAIMGSYGLTGMGLVVFGSVAKRVAHKASCSVMVVRERDYEYEDEGEEEEREEETIYENEDDDAGTEDGLGEEGETREKSKTDDMDEKSSDHDGQSSTDGDKEM